jgi:hypothetical protein
MKTAPVKVALIAVLAAATTALGACSDDGDSADTPEPVRAVNADDYVVYKPVAGDPSYVTCRAGLLHIDGSRGTSTELVADCDQALEALRTGAENIEPASAGG